MSGTMLGQDKPLLREFKPVLGQDEHLGIPGLSPGSPGFGKLGLGIPRLKRTQPEP